MGEHAMKILLIIFLAIVLLVVGFGLGCLFLNHIIKDLFRR